MADHQRQNAIVSIFYRPTFSRYKNGVRRAGAEGRLGWSGDGSGTEETFYTGIKPAEGRDGAKGNPDAKPQSENETTQIGIERVGRTKWVAHED